jgi:hypothetical protein
MSKVYYIIIIGVLFLNSCKNSEKINLSDPIDSGRGFIESSLKGEYDVAKKYMLQDSINNDFLDRLKDVYNKKMSQAEKDGLKNANIIINSTDNLNDSEQIINYSNTFRKMPDKIKVVKKNNEWRVDFKYTFSGNM